MKRILGLFLIFMLFTPPLLAYADRGDTDAVISIGESAGEVALICRKANDVANEEILVYTSSDTLLSFSNKKYSKLTVDVKREFMEVALLTTKESSLGDRIKNKVYNFIEKQDTTNSAAVRYLRSDVSADFASASMWFKPFSGVIGTILGVLSLLIFMFLAISIIIDIAYMVLPAFRLLLEKGVEDKPTWVSKEAYSSVKECESSISSNSYKGYMSMYFRRRLVSVFIMAITLGYLISGEIYSIISYIIDAFS